jgi:Flp pilus assembly pilin Flp
MVKFIFNKILKNSNGQSAVEYILLLAVISALGTTVLRNKKFKDFIAGKNGLFANMKLGMAYSYRYGRTADQGAEAALGFDYSTNKHDTYYNSSGGASGGSHFFTNADPYPKQ